MKRNTISSKLLQENERMERRLQVLKELMSAEKARREVSGGIHWESGQPGSVSHSTSHNLLPPPTDLFSAPANKAGTKRHIKVKFLNENQPERTSGDKSSIRCGQCVKNMASLVCVECKENYCQVCYAKMHHKGAMAQHHVRPILNKFRPLPHKVVDNQTVNVAAVGQENTANKSSNESMTSESCTERGGAGTERGGALLDGTYDEQGSAQSFQDALKEWRNGRNSTVSESKELSVASPRKVNTMSDGIQAGEGSITERKDITLRFPEAPGMSYFERLVLQRCRESPGKNPFLTNSNKGSRLRQSFPDEAEKEEESYSVQGDPDTPVVSEYNLFYDNGDNEDAVGFTSIQEDVLMDFTKAEVTIEEVQTTDTPHINDVFVATPEKAKEKSETESVAAAKCKAEVDTRLAANTKIKAKPKPLSKKTKRPRSEKKAQNVRVKKVQDALTADKSESRVRSEAVQQLSEGELARSVEQAWLKCADSNYRKPTLGVFFLHGVDSSNDEVDHPVKTNDIRNRTLINDFKLGGKIWTPDISAITESKSTPVVAGRVDTPTQRSGARSGFADPYYKDDGSDSEPENEREDFICSRLGNVRESIELALQASRPGTATLYDREDDEEEEMEREQADYDAIESLASELLASTADFERAMSSSRMQEQEEEGGGEVEEEDMEGMSEEIVGVGVASLEEDDMGMSKIQSDFDLFQRNLIDQDSD